MESKEKKHKHGKHKLEDSETKCKEEPQDWKEWHAEKKRLKKERKEKKLLKQAEKSSKIDEEIKEDAKEKPTLANFSTVSIALPGSILDNAQSPELRTYLAGQIARAAAVFSVDEVVIFNESSSASAEEKTTEGEFHGIGKKGQADVQMARILQYLECPQYLRKFYFPMHKDFEYAGVLNPLDAPHHLRVTDECQYREGVVLNKPAKDNKSCVNIGLQKEIEIDKAIQPGIRVTVEVDQQNKGKKLKGKVVSPSTPYSEAGIYWGYKVRLAATFNEVFSESPHQGGYDLIIGTSENGDLISEVTFEKSKHVLVIFGGLKGLEYCIDSDQSLESSDPRSLFHYYLNVCPGQGSRTIRTEEAILIALAVLKPKLNLKT